MLGAGTVINPLIKVVTTVAILAAVYVFIVKPALDTTNSAFESVTDAFDGFDDLPSDVQAQIDNALDSTDSERLQHCIERAIEGPGGVNQNAIDRCIDRHGR